MVAGRVGGVRDSVGRGGWGRHISGVNSMVVVIVEHTEGVGDGVHHRLGDLLPGLVAAKHSAPVGSEVEVDEGLDSQVSCREKLVGWKNSSQLNLTVIVGSGLQ